MPLSHTWSHWSFLQSYRSRSHSTDVFVILGFIEKLRKASFFLVLGTKSLKTKQRPHKRVGGDTFSAQLSCVCLLRVCQNRRRRHSHTCQNILKHRLCTVYIFQIPHHCVLIRIKSDASTRQQRRGQREAQFIRLSAVAGVKPVTAARSLSYGYTCWDHAQPRRRKMNTARSEPPPSTVRALIPGDKYLLWSINISVSLQSDCVIYVTHGTKGLMATFKRCY